MKMSVFFKKEPVSWTVYIRTNEVRIFKKALKSYGINGKELKRYKNGFTAVEFKSVCTELMKIGTEFGRQLTMDN